MMKVIDFHVHVGTTEQWTPTVVEYFPSRNPPYWREFGDKISPEKVITYLKTQGVDHAQCFWRNMLRWRQALSQTNLSQIFVPVMKS